MNTVEQLKIATQIEESKQAGNPIEWDFKTPNGDWTSAHTTYGTPIYAIHSGCEIRLKPWTLGRSINGHTLPDGAAWHRQDWTREMLPAGYRPLILGESIINGDEMADSSYRPNWSAQVIPEGGIIYEGWMIRYLYRTTRPIPLPDKWAKEKAAFAEGKVIQSRWTKSDSLYWSDNLGPVWLDEHEYRIKPEPVMVELGPEDVPIGSAVKSKDWADSVWAMVNWVGATGINIATKDGWKNYSDLRQDGWLIHRPSKPGIWEKCEKPSHE